MKLSEKLDAFFNYAIIGSEMAEALEYVDEVAALEQRQAKLEATIDAGIIASLESNATAAQVRIVMRAALEEHAKS